MNEDKNGLTGIFYALFTFILWGLLPLYWRLLAPISAAQILANRILWSFILVMSILAFSGKFKLVKEALSNKKTARIMVGCAIFIAANWFFYLYGVTNNRVVEVSMGYYINPLLTIVIGMVFLKEKLNRIQALAVLLALAGVLILTIQYGRFPWVAICLAVAFSFYGLLKKKLGKVDSLVGLAMETSLMLPIAVVYLLWTGIEGTGVLGNIGVAKTILLLCSALATVVPLLGFAEAAKRMQLVSLGFLQYIYPSTTLLLGIFVFKEDFTSAHVYSFILIWLGLILYSLGQVKTQNKTS